ncbi:MAG: hypothetical protein ABEH78_04225 [Haloferacaceae archaeon]
MNLEELRDVRRTERERDGLQSLPESFYRDVSAYLADLKAERERAAEAADDPFSDPRVSELTDEIETAEEVVESIYERRLGKVVDRASFAAADMRHETEGLTAEEQELFDDLVARIAGNRERVLDALDPDAGADATAEPDADATADPNAGDDARADPDGQAAAAPDDAARAGTGGAGADADAPDPNDLLAEAMGGAPDGETREETAEGADPDPAAVEAGATGGPGTTDGGVPTGSGDVPESADEDPVPVAATGDGAGRAPHGQADDGGNTDRTGGQERDGASDRSDAPDTDRRMIYVTRDVGEIFGVDERTYSLEAEDVVDLPADNARALVERDAAEPLE